MISQSRQVTSRERNVHAELRLHELHARIDLLLQSRWHPVFGRIYGHTRTADEVVGAASDFASVWQFASVADAGCRGDESGGVQVEHRLRPGLVAPAGVVPPEHQQIRNP